MNRRGFHLPEFSRRTADPPDEPYGRFYATQSFANHASETTRPRDRYHPSRRFDPVYDMIDDEQDSGELQLDAFGT